MHHVTSRTLARGAFPSERPYTIAVERDGAHEDLKATLGNGGPSAILDVKEGQAFQYLELVDCSVKPVDLVWGLLTTPGASAELNTRPLRHVPAPGGTLVYGVSRGAGDTLTIRAANGSTISSHTLVPPPAHHQCVGAAESSFGLN